jgi:hypothetical protein
VHRCRRPWSTHRVRSFTLDFRSDRLPNVFIILAYAPFLLFLPVLLLAGVVFVVVPGGFIIVLGGLYYTATWFAGLLGLAANRRWRAHTLRVRPANPSIERTPLPGRASFGPPGVIAPTPAAVALRHDRVVRPAPSRVPRRRALDDVGLVGPLHRGSAPDRHPSSPGPESRA